MSRDLGNSSGSPKWFEISHKIEEFVKAEKKLNANVDFYSASTYHTLGIDVDLFTPIFAVSRICGWAAHVIEQLNDNRLIRPRAEYLGPEYPNQYMPMTSARDVAVTTSVPPACGHRCRESSPATSLESNLGRTRIS